MKTPPILLDSSRVRLHGGSYVITVTKRVRDALGVKLGDFVIFRRYGRSVFMTVIRESVTTPVSRSEDGKLRPAVGA